MSEFSIPISWVYVPVKDSYDRAIKTFSRLCKHRHKLDDCKRKKFKIRPSQERKQKLNATKLKYMHQKKSQ